MIKKTKINFIFLWRQNDWGLYKRRNECILWELSKRDAVGSILHLEPITPKVLIGIIIKWLKATDNKMRRAYRMHIKKSIYLKPLIVNHKKNIYVKSVFVLYGGSNPILKKIFDFFLKIQLKKINQKISSLKDNIVIIAYPPSSYLIEAIHTINHDVLIADLVDDVIARTEDVFLRNRIIENYKNILPQCKWIFSTSPVFDDKYRNYAQQKIDFLPNGVDFDEFSINSDEQKSKKEVRKTVGYVGSINKVMDLDLLEHVILDHPEVDFVFIGFADKEHLKYIDRLIKKYQNFHFLGERNFEDIPNLLSDFDILINFKKPGFMTMGNDSMKIYEYLATGKPIISTPVPPSNRFKDIIYVASDKFTLSEYLKQALEENDPKIRKKRMEVALQNSWAKRVDIILDKLSNLL